jgi:hypothetical protein
MRLGSQLARRYCQMFSTGFSSGAREGRKIGVILLGTLSLAVVCHPARSSNSTAWAPSADVAGDLVEVKLHGLGVGVGQRKRGADPARGKNGAEEIGAFVALVGGLAGPRSAPRPLPYEAVLLADARFVLKPDFDRRGRRQAIDVSAQGAREVFLDASTIAASCAGWRGRALMWEKPSFLSSFPT